MYLHFFQPSGKVRAERASSSEEKGGTPPPRTPPTTTPAAAASAAGKGAKPKDKKVRLSTSDGRQVRYPYLDLEFGISIIASFSAIFRLIHD